MRRAVVGTAGHIDHGKTALVSALTGTDTDRLPEEKRRGITIDLGYAAMRLDDDVLLGIVDVPGHEAFVRNMLAGVTGIDVGLLVVAADEGVMPQTREHLAILDLLDVGEGVVAITKADSVADADWLALVADDVRLTLADTCLADAELVVVSSRTGTGLDQLKRALAVAAARVQARATDDAARLPIDRAFTVHGTGTVVTGTLWSGRVQRDDTLVWLPAGRTTRIRAVHVHGEEREAAVAGERTALALSGVDRRAVHRGDVLVSGEGWRPASMLTVELRVLRDAPAPIRQAQRVRVHIATTEALGRVAILDGAAAIAPGEARWVQLRLERPVVARNGDRFVIRSYSPVTTIGGGIVAEPAARRRRRIDAGGREQLERLLTGTAPERLAAAVQLAGADGLAAADAAVRARASARDAAPRHGVLEVGDRLVAAGVLEAAEDAVLCALDASHAAQPLRRGATRDELRAVLRKSPDGFADAVLGRLAAATRIRVDGVWVRAAGFERALAGGQRAAAEHILTALDASGFAGLDSAAAAAAAGGRTDVEAILELLLDEGKVVRLADGRVLSIARWQEAVALASEALTRVHAMGVAEFKTLFNLSRRHLIPLLEQLDAIGVTVRDGDVRRAAASAAP